MYLPPGRWSHLDEKLAAKLDGAFTALPEPVLTGSSWTTDAPYRETATAIAAAEAAGIACVEMVAAALYAYAIARQRSVVCLAHITNTMATDGAELAAIPTPPVPPSLLAWIAACPGVKPGNASGPRISEGAVEPPPDRAAPECDRA